ncbi:MAG: ECF transporter S component [Clostridia bacterium]|nr:ECF transporter S component [Clostridia bacterium]
MTNKKAKIFRLALLSLFIAIILVMDFTPLGYIVTPSGFSVTLLTIPVALGAVCTNVSGGAILGFVFGLTSFIQAFGLGFSLDPSAPILFETNPFAYTVTCFLPRILVGIISALIFKAFERANKVNILAYILSAASVPLFNTLLFMTCFATFYKNTILGGKAVMTVVFSAFTLNFLVEFAVTLIAGVVINRIIYTYLKKLN